MPIIIKEIHVKSTIVDANRKSSVSKEELLNLRKDMIKELKEYLHREYLRKHER